MNLVQIFSGSYTLSEAGPAGFTPGTWVCQGGTVDPATGIVTVAPGTDVSCQITNTAVAPRLTLVKVVDNGTDRPDPRPWRTSRSRQPTARSP